jgi:hypothetical protein
MTIFYKKKRIFSNFYASYKYLGLDPDPARIHIKQSLESGLDPHDIQQQNPESEFSKIPGSGCRESGSETMGQTQKEH